MRANDNRRWTGWILVLALSGAAAAQEVPHPLLAKAKIVEEAEHDLEAAAKLYAQVAHDGGLGAVVRAEAFLRLAKVRARQGDLAAAQVALENAARGEGAAAEEARKRLAEPQDPQKGDRSVDLEILRLMMVVREQQGAARAKEALGEIVWFGGRAVSLLAEAVRTETDFGFVTYCAEGLLQIGGDEVDAWIDEARYEDPLRRRAVARAVGSASAAQTRRFAAFLGDPVAEVRVEAVQSGVLVDWTQATVLLRDEDARVCEATLAWLRGTTSSALRAGEFPPPGQQYEVTRALLEVLEERHAGSQRFSDVSRRLLNGVHMTADPVDRAALFLRFVQVSGIQLSSNYGVRTPNLRSPNTLVDEVLAAARSVREIDPSGPEAWRLSVCRSVLNAVTLSWNREALPAVLDLAELGHPCDNDWFAENLEPEDWVTVFENLDVFVGLAGPPNPLLKTRIDPNYLRNSFGHTLEIELPERAFEPLQQAFDRWLARPEDQPPSWRVVEYAAVRLGMFDSEQSLAWCERALTTGLAATERVRGEPEAVEALQVALLRGFGTKDSPARRAMLRRVLVTEGEDLGELRNRVLSLLVFLGDEEVAPLFGKAYELGLAESDFPRPWNVQRSSHGAHRGLRWLAKAGGNRISVRGVTVSVGSEAFGAPWSAEERIAAVDAALATQRVDVWEDAKRLGFPQDIASTVARHALACPHQQLRLDFLTAMFHSRAGLDVAGQSRLAIRMLADPAAQIRWRGLREIRSNGWPLDSEAFALVVDCLGSADPNTAVEAIGVVQETGNPEHYAMIAALLESPSWQIRVGAATALAALDPTRAGRDLVALFSDRSQSVRWGVCSLAEMLLDARLVPPLIERLHDPDDGVREKAKVALEAIEYFVSQEARWQRLLGEAGLDAPNAAEALIKQAREAGEKRIRLAAIQSLGTLALPETLPFLIQLMQDEDAELAQAAASAVERINSRE